MMSTMGSPREGNLGSIQVCLTKFHFTSSRMKSCSVCKRVSLVLHWLTCSVYSSVRLAYRTANPYTGHEKTRKVTCFLLIMFLQWRDISSSLYASGSETDGDEFNRNSGGQVIMGLTTGPIYPPDLIKWPVSLNRKVLCIQRDKKRRLVGPRSIVLAFAEDHASRLDRLVPEPCNEYRDVG